jgi:hypothetical protein
MGTTCNWYQWPLDDRGLPATPGDRPTEVHVVPDVERYRHRPQECWCNPVLDVMDDGVPRFTHRLRGAG